MKFKFTELLALTAVISVMALTGCGARDPEPVTDAAATQTETVSEASDNTDISETAPDEKEDHIKVMASIFPEYDWTREIIGDADTPIELSLLLNNGVDLHSYQPTTDDFINISDCDLFIYIGGQSDEWMEDAVSQAMNKDMKVIRMTEELHDNLLKADLLNTPDHEETEECEHHHEFDEHVWLSVKNAEIICRSITDALKELDPANADVFESNFEAYQAKLADLDGRYQAVRDEAQKDTVVFGDRFPFLYLFEDYDINCFAAFHGCSAESEASFQTIAELSGIVDEKDLHAILTIEKSDETIAKTILSNAKSEDIEILTMDSMQSTTAEDIENGATYLSLMEQNLDVLKEALN